MFNGGFLLKSGISARKSLIFQGFWRFLPPGRGLPSREAKVLKNLSFLSFLFVRICDKNHRMVSASVTGPQYQALIFQTAKRGSRGFEL